MTRSSSRVRERARDERAKGPDMIFMIFDPSRTAEQRRALPSPPDHSFVRPSCRPSMGQPSPADHPSNPKSVRPTDRPVLPRCKTSIVLTATIFTLFTTTTKETTKEVARPKAAPPLLWWRPQAATFVVALNRVNIVAVNTILVLYVGKPGRRTVGRTDA